MSTRVLGTAQQFHELIGRQSTGLRVVRAAAGSPYRALTSRFVSRVQRIRLRGIMFEECLHVRLEGLSGLSGVNLYCSQYFLWYISNGQCRHIPRVAAMHALQLLQSSDI